MEHVQTLADGTHITQTTQKVMLYRDSAGRTRTEHIILPPPGAVMAPHPAFIGIVDPVAGYRYMLDQNNQAARRTPWPPAAVHRAIKTASATSSSNNGTQAPNIVLPSIAQIPSSTGSTRPNPAMSHESLGTQNIEGIIAEGTRMTTTYPEGFFGNDRPITVVSEPGPHRTSR